MPAKQQSRDDGFDDEGEDDATEEDSSGDREVARTSPGSVTASAICSVAESDVESSDGARSGVTGPVLPSVSVRNHRGAVVAPGWTG
jgi:hypothetical protein